MAPSANFFGAGGGGGGTPAFVPCKEASFLRRRSTASTSTTSLSPCTFSTTSLSSSASLADDSFFRGGDQSQQGQQRVSRPDEPNLFEIPPELSATYRPIPLLLQLFIGIASALVVGRSSISQLFTSSSSLFTQSLRQILLVAPLPQRLLSFAVVRKALFFLLRTALLSTIAKLSIQEAFFMPSSVTPKHLAERGQLPSRLSKYTVVKPVAVSAPSNKKTDAKDNEQVSISASSWKEDDSSPPTVPIGVHSIQYTQQNNNGSKHKYDGIYLHHGFGASSLSWLPVFPALVDRLGSGSARGVAHDAPGFGFTDRPNADVDGGLEQYGFENNVGIGLALLNDSLSEQDASTDDAQTDDAPINGGANQNEAKSIAIFGHSMGSKSALLTALHYASHPKLQLKPNLVVLVAPALEGVSLPSRKGYGLKKKSSSAKESNGWVRILTRRVWIAWKKVFLDYPFRYGLRRVVCGTKDFWRRGLALAWGDPNRLSDSDVLRFQWASVTKGWEEGLINFTRSRILSSPAQHALDDEQLLREVANLKDTKVVIIYGSNDKVVRIEGSVAETLKRDFPNVKVVRMEGLGHDPYEEDVDGFLFELEKALE